MTWQEMVRIDRSMEPCSRAIYSVSTGNTGTVIGIDGGWVTVRWDDSGSQQDIWGAFTRGIIADDDGDPRTPEFGVGFEPGTEQPE